MLILGGWLFFISNPNICYFFWLVLLAENGMKEGRRDKETSEGIKTQLHNHENSPLNLKNERQLWEIKLLPSKWRSEFFLPRVSFCRQEASSFSEFAQIVLPVRDLLGDCYFFCIYFNLCFLSSFISLLYCYHFYLLFSPHIPSVYFFISSPSDATIS